MEYRGPEFKKNYFLKSEEKYEFVLRISHILLHNKKCILILEKIKVNFDKKFNCFTIGDNSMQMHTWLELTPTDHLHPFILNKIPNGKIGFKIPII